MGPTDTERREFFRLSYKAPIQMKFYDIPEQRGSAHLAAGSVEGSAKNISQKGVLFQTEETPPRLSSIVWMNLDKRTLKICQEIESRALILNNGVLGKVVRVEEDRQNDNAYDVGVCFLRKDQEELPEVRRIFSTLQ